jgi:hypothetical protein
VTGYFAGYLVYLLTVVIPTTYRNQFVMKAACEQLCTVYVQSVYLLLLMAKSAMDENSWTKMLAYNRDLECFDNIFYKAMSKFDVTREAETMLKKPNKEKTETLKWYEYLQFRLESIYEEIDKITLKYQSNMSEDLVDRLYSLKKCHLFEMFLGKSLSTSYVYKGIDGNEYLESVPLSLYFDQAINKVSPIFGINHGLDGGNVLREYVENLKQLYKMIKKYVNDERTKENNVLDLFRNHNLGHIGTAILEIENYIEVKYSK